MHNEKILSSLSSVKSVLRNIAGSNKLLLLLLLPWIRVDADDKLSRRIYKRVGLSKQLHSACVLALMLSDDQQQHRARLAHRIIRLTFDLSIIVTYCPTFDIQGGPAKLRPTYICDSNI